VTNGVFIKTPPLTEVGKRMSNKVKVKIWSRWYEKDKELLTFISNLKRIPSWLVDVYCKVIIYYASQLHGTDNNKQYHLQHGSEKHLALLKSMGRRRWYDKNKYAYRAFNALFLMESSSRRSFMLRLNESINLLHCYQDRCELYNLKPSSDVFEVLLKTWVISGEYEAYHQIDELESLGGLAKEY
jgi:hypothetical protein